jgi:ATP-dependent exoDNAse (exonuclease V) alpha subunit
VNIDGTTLHSAFHIRPTTKYEIHQYSKPASQDLQDMRANYQNLKILIIDEISMISQTLLQKLHLTLQDIYENDEPFGSISILAVGDLLQLPPVAAKPVFYDASKEEDDDSKNLNEPNTDTELQKSQKPNKDEKLKN